MIYLNNPASTFNIKILINLAPIWPAPRSHVPWSHGLLW